MTKPTAKKKKDEPKDKAEKVILRTCSRGEFANYMGVNRQTIKMAVAKKRIRTLNPGRKTTEPDIIDLTTQGPEYQRSSNVKVDMEAVFARYDEDRKTLRAGKKPTNPYRDPALEAMEVGAEQQFNPDGVEVDEDGVPKGLSYNDARMMKEFYQGQNAKLEYEKALGTVVPLDKVTAELEQIGITIQRALLAIPGRVASLFANDGKDIKRVNRIMTDELRDVLSGLTAELKRIQA